MHREWRRPSQAYCLECGEKTMEEGPPKSVKRPKNAEYLENKHAD